MDKLVCVGKKDMTIDVESNICIVLDPSVYVELLEFVSHYNTEVSGCGIVEKIEQEDKVEFRVSKVFLPSKQDNSSAYTDISQEEVHNLLYELTQKGIDTSKLRLHWHSHNNMDTFHSGTDVDNYKTLNNGDYLISLVLNKDEAFLGRVDYYKPIHFSVSGVPVYVGMSVNAVLSDEAKDSIDKLDEYIKSKAVEPLGYGYNYWNNQGKWEHWREDKHESKILTEQEVKAVLRKKYNISKKRANKFIDCEDLTCEGCQDRQVCMAFNCEFEHTLYGGVESYD